MAIALGGGGGPEDCQALGAAQQSSADTSAAELVLPSGKIHWCYCQLTEEEGQMVAAQLSLPDGSVAPLEATVFTDPVGAACADFVYRFSTIPPEATHTFSADLSGRKVTDRFIPLVSQVEFDGWRADEPVRVILYAYLSGDDGSGGDATFVDNVRTQADAGGKLRVSTANPDDNRVYRVMVFAVGQSTDCRMLDTSYDMRSPSGCTGPGSDFDNPIRTWTYDGTGPVYVYWQACPDAPRSRLHAGDQAIITHRLKRLPLRATAGSGGDVLAEIAAEQKVDVLDGPVCADGLVWWKLKSLDGGITGWSPEREDESSAFLLYVDRIQQP